ncbi:MAG: hypothetical protein ACI4VT_00670 [Bacilli bacterium]
MKKILLLLIAFWLFGCDEYGDKQIQTRNGSYTPIKVCPIGCAQASSCVDYKAVSYTFGSNTIRIKTLDGHRYMFNTNGWAFIITKE